MASPESRSKPRQISPKRAVFVREYLIDLNATQAAIRAGYSKRTATSQGERLLRFADVRDAVAVAMAERAKRTEINADWVLTELARIGKSDIRKVVTWGEAVLVRDPETGEQITTNGVAIIASDEIEDDAALSIAEVSQGRDGTMKVKLHDKLGALEKIGRHLGMFNDKLTLKGEAENPLSMLVKSIQGTAIKPVAVPPSDDGDGQ